MPSWKRMPSLREVQASFIDALLGSDTAPAAALVDGDGLPPRARLEIYRHHAIDSLTAALQAAYPVVARLVGDGFFRYAAHEFIRAEPPAGPCLFEYGEGFPGFLATFPPGRSLEYLPDVARLEWKLNAAAHADDFVPVDLGRLLGLDPDDAERVTFQLDPSLSLLASPWPIDAIWHANQPEVDPDRTVDLDAGAVHLEIRRVDDNPAFRRLAPATFAFRRILLTGFPLSDALTAAHAEDHAFDVTDALRALFEENVLGGFRLSPETKASAS